MNPHALRGRALAALCLLLPSVALAAPGPSGAPAAGASASAASTAAPMTLARLPIPGPRPFVKVARDILDVAFTLDPSLASGAGLFDDALRVPTYGPAPVGALSARLVADLKALRALPWRSYPVDVQVDVRWLYAVAETLHRQLTVERVYVRRPAQWLEPLANNLIALGSYAPDRPELQDRVLAMVPAMLQEVRTVATEPTRRDLETGVRVARALEGMARLRSQAPVAEALAAWAAEAERLTPSRDFGVIGKDNYAWRYEHSLLFPRSPEELLADARLELTRIDAALAALPPVPEVAPDEAARVEAAALTQERLLALYDSVQAANRAATIAGGWVTVPEAVGPILTRPTPEAMIPLTGDGGSMNPPPTYAASNIGYWNVEHFTPDWTEAARLQTVTAWRGFRENGAGTYAAHEGFPGHHLQLSIARLNPDPIRSILPDCPQNEGWGLYAESVFAAHGGLGSGPGAQRAVLGSSRGRVARVVYDVQIEQGSWTLQEAADWKYRAAPGEGRIDEDLARAVNWPTQLVCYQGGKSQIIALRDAVAAREGAAFDERRFHDAFLAEGSIPIALIRAKMLGEPVPDLPAALP